jgi:oligoribonuclease
MSAIKQILVWIDLEMSGLDLAKDHILEIAVNLTDFSRQLAPINSNQKENTLHLVINHPKSLLDSMDEWCTQHHGESGLTALVQQSAISMAEAEERVLQFLQSHGLEPRQALLAGNSVHVDRSFLLKDMPRVIQFLHYRIVDVSSVCERVCELERTILYSTYL